jgi:AcrR family transcriptional regulator
VARAPASQPIKATATFPIRHVARTQHSQPEPAPALEPTTLTETIITRNDRFMKSATDRYATLLDLIVDSLLATGVADLSLRPLAERVGTSARLLIYHFDTKENLVVRALEQVRARATASLKTRALERRPDSLRAFLTMFWEWALEDTHRSYFRLLFEVDALSMYDRLQFSRETRRADAAVWLTLIEGATARLRPPERDASQLSTLILAAITGLLQDFISTGERARTTAALQHLIDLIPGANRREHVSEKA